jgi:branched-chain amino acid aminotransferase
VRFGDRVREPTAPRRDPDADSLADEVFLTGTAAEVTPVREIDGIRIGNGVRGPVTERLQARYFDAVHGRLPERSAWLSPYRV